MPALNLVGPSYVLRNAKADRERVVNWMPVLIESAQGKGGASSYLKQCPGLSAPLVNLGAPLRGIYVARGVLYAVAGLTLYEISASWAATSRGTLGTSTGIVSMAANDTQVCAVDGPNGYVYDLDAVSFSTIDTNWRGSSRVEVIDGYGIFFDPDTPQFYISANQDFTSLDALDYATAEGATGDIISFLVKYRELMILKTNTGEFWQDAGDADFAFARNAGANVEVGLAAANTLQKIGGVAYWLGRDERGLGTVFAMPGYKEQRISSHSLEEALSGVTDLSGAYAFTYWQEGLSFYVLQVPGLTTTWVYEVAAGIWHERAELVDGEFQPWRATCHAHCYGVHIVGDAAGNLYKLDPLVNTNSGDPLARDRITAHLALPTNARQRVGSIQIDGQTGDGLPDGSEACLLLRYSDDGGRTWGNWRQLTLGAIGQYKARARATLLGAARDRVWQIRVTDDVRFEPMTAIVNEV